MKDDVLAGLISPTPVDELLARPWPGELLVTHGAGNLARELGEIPTLASPLALLAHCRRAGRGLSRDGLTEQRSARPQDLRRWYEEGKLVSFNRAECEVVELTPYLRRLEAQLGLRFGDISCQILVGQPGAGVEGHFDSTPTFHLQVHGTKRWRLAPNTAVTNPPAGMMLGSATPRSIARCMREPIPTRMPPTSSEVVAHAGTTIFLPLGLLHETEAATESLAVLFTLDPKSHAKNVLQRIEATLSTAAEWRAPAIGVAPRDAVTRAATRARLEELLADLRGQVNALTADALLEAWSENPPARMQLADGLSLVVEAEEVPFVILRFATRERRLAIAAGHVDVYRWLARATGTFDLREATWAAGDDAAHVLERLRELGLVVDAPR